MKLMKLALDGVDLFKDKRFEIDFIAHDRVVDQNAVHQIEGRIYSQNVIAFTGINAVGKTSVLRLIELVLKILTDNLSSLERVPFAENLQKGFKLNAIVSVDENMYYLESDISLVPKTLWETKPMTYDILFNEEMLFVLERKLHTKSEVASFEAFKKSATLLERRSKIDNEASRYLSNNRSIFSSIVSRPNQVMLALHGEIQSSGPIASPIIQVFDPSIDYIVDEKDLEQRLRMKFKTDREERFTNSNDLENLLSSGTIRGSGIVQSALRVLKTGGYYFIDEIESHLNKQLVGVLISLFASSEINPNGATLIFTTHYPEVLDFIKRKDNVYFMIRNKEHQTEVIRYSDRVKRIENKKSEVFFSNYIKGTAPNYTEVSALQKYVSKIVGSDDNS